MRRHHDFALTLALATSLDANQLRKRWFKCVLMMWRATYTCPYVPDLEAVAAAAVGVKAAGPAAVAVVGVEAAAAAVAGEDCDRAAFRREAPN
jgi:hypothetical protein